MPISYILQTKPPTTNFALLYYFIDLTQRLDPINVICPLVTPIISFLNRFNHSRSGFLLPTPVFSCQRLCHSASSAHISRDRGVYIRHKLSVLTDENLQMQLHPDENMSV